MMSSKGCLIHTHNNVGESQNNYAQCKKLVKNKPPPKKEESTLYNSIYVKLYKIQSTV